MQKNTRDEMCAWDAWDVRNTGQVIQIKRKFNILNNNSLAL